MPCWMSANSMLLKTVVDGDPIVMKSMSDFDRILGTIEQPMREPDALVIGKLRVIDISPTNQPIQTENNFAWQKWYWSVIHEKHKGEGSVEGTEIIEFYSIFIIHFASNFSFLFLKLPSCLSDTY